MIVLSTVSWAHPYKLLIKEIPNKLAVGQFYGQIFFSYQSLFPNMCRFVSSHCQDPARTEIDPNSNKL